MEPGLRDIAAFVATRQALPEHRSGYVGLEAGSILDFYEEYSVRFVVESAGDRLTGVLGIDHDAEIARTCVHGPYIATDDWHDAAERLWDRAHGLIPSPTETLEISWAASNHNVETFADRHGFEVFSDGHVLRFERASPKKEDLRSQVVPIEPRDRARVAALHDELFPSAWIRGERLVRAATPARPLLVIRVDEEAAGYLYLETNPALGEASIEFVGVAPPARGRGLGRALVEAALARAFEQESIPAVELFVRSDNAAGLALYESAGFTKLWRLKGARRHAAPDP